METQLRKENQLLREERDGIFETRAQAKAETQSLAIRCDNYIKEIEFLKNELDNMKLRLVDMEMQLSHCQASLSDAHKENVENALAIERRASEKLANSDKLRADDVNRIRELALEEGTERHNETVAMFESRLSEMEIRLGELTIERDEARQTAQQYADILEESKDEINALKLRLKVHENTVLDFQKKIEFMNQNQKIQDAFSSGIAVGAGVDPSPEPPILSVNNATPHSHNHNNQHPNMNNTTIYGNPNYRLDGIHSPAFSEDFGPASIPDSPYKVFGATANSMSSSSFHNFQSNKMMNNLYRGNLNVGFDSMNNLDGMISNSPREYYNNTNQHQNQGILDNHHDRFGYSSLPIANIDRDRQHLKEENEHLKSVIKEVMSV